MLIFNLLVGMCLAFEIHKLMDFRLFSRMNYLSVKYSKQIKLRNSDTKFIRAVRNIAWLDLVYIIVLLIGLFGKQGMFFVIMIWASIITNYMVKKTNRKWSSIIFLVDGIFSIIKLTLILVNYFFFKMECSEFLKYLIS